ncbi:MAG: hypothetical protein HC866_08545 [Leptolyngbyaceae cyanobacterium RU_5_1]|nr:hypothetical protein [Leptolyngbyaceae cyanobacterium RU_5_1]
MGIAVLGTGVGVAIGEYSYQDVKKKSEDVHQEFRIVQDLKSSLASAQLHERTLAALVQVSNRRSIQPHRMQAEFRKEYAELQNYAKAADQAWLALKASYREPAVEESQAELAIFQSLVADYDGVTGQYVKLIDQHVATVEMATGQFANPAALRSILIELDRHSLSSGFHEFVHNSERLFEIFLEEDDKVRADLGKRSS